MSDLTLALDLGGTKLEAALVDESGRLLPQSRARHPTGATIDAVGLRRAIDQVVTHALSAAPPGSQVMRIGAGSAGPIDQPRGAISPVNLREVSGFRLRDEIAAAAHEHGCDAPVVVGHDGACLALAESWIGATQTARASLSMVVSTGIGGGFVIDGMPLGGASGNAGHLGQVRAGDEPLTLEQIASGPASTAWARAQGWTGQTGEDLGNAAATGDPVAQAAIERSAKAVGTALAGVSTLLDLDVVAIGGGFSRVSEDYVELVGIALQAGAVLEYARATRVVRAGSGADGPLIGAAALASRLH